MSDYYAFLSSLTTWANAPLSGLSQELNVPLLTAFILGLLGAASPCQLTTNISALAYVARRPAVGESIWSSALLYVLGKVVVYTLAGVLIILLGLRLQQASLPVIQTARKVLGPALIVFGLYLLGVFRFRFVVGQRLSDRLEDLSARAGRMGPFLLGLAFSFAFCPTLFLLFFGLLVPLSLSTRGGLLFPGVFAIGTSVPLLVFAALLGLGLAGARSFSARVKTLEHHLGWVVGIIFLLAGLNETLIYWLW